MDLSSLARWRMRSQHLWGTPLATPEEVVGWLGAMQAQEYSFAKWAVAQRANRADDAMLEGAVTEGSILRTHVLRPTWHFVLPADIRWMLSLTAPRVKARNARRYRELGLDDRIFEKSNRVMAKAVEGGVHLTRKELAAILDGNGVDVTGQRLPYLLMGAELDAVLCNGALRGKQHTYALLDERAPKPRMLDRDEAVVELVRRFFTARGPATLRDFSWWSSLTTADGRRGLDMLAGEVDHLLVDGRMYWFATGSTPGRARSTSIDLVHVYDEAIMSYTESRDVLHGTGGKRSLEGQSATMHAVLLNGQLIGRWRRAAEKNLVVLEMRLERRLNEAEARALDLAAKRYARFLGVPTISVKPT